MANKELKILCLSFWTPPIVRPQSILIDKMIKEWMKKGIRPVILTYDICGDWKIDLAIYKIPQLDVFKPFLKIPGMVTFFEYFYFRKIFKIAKEIINKHQINLVFSFSNPNASNILGAMIKKKLGIKFISHFSDPWLDNPLKTFSFFGGKKVRFLEKYVVENSDRIIFITQETENLVMKKYGFGEQRKARVIPHCFAPEDYPDVQKSSERFIFSYIGAFYTDRNPKIIFEAFKNLMKIRELKNKFELKLIGTSLDYARFKTNLPDMIRSYGLEKAVEVIPAVDYKKSLEYMKISDCLLVLDADFPNSPFLPSKAVDYAASGTTIVGITPQNSATAKFLTRLGYKSFSYDKVDKLSEYFYKLITGAVMEKINKDYLNEFNVSATTAKLINQFEEVIKES
jgi:glycosyltransferase involved in cell wall biosynthesis